LKMKMILLMFEFKHTNFPGTIFLCKISKKSFQKLCASKRRIIMIKAK